MSLSEFRNFVKYPINTNKIGLYFEKYLVHEKLTAINALSCVLGYFITMRSVMEPDDEKNLLHLFEHMKQMCMKKHVLSPGEQQLMISDISMYAKSFESERPSSSS